jgi:predicted acyl esterase
VVALAAVVPTSAAADPIPKGAVWRQAFLRSQDGTSLHADVFRPARSVRRHKATPVALVVSPYLGLPEPEASGGASPPHILSYYRRFYARAIRKRISIVQVSLRGTGESGGCGDLGGPAEQGDVRAAVRWAAHRRWSTGRIGVFGHSYDGYTALVSLAERLRPVKAAAVFAPAFSNYRAAYMNGVPYLQGREIAAYYQAFSVIVAPPSAPGALLDSAEGRAICGPAVIAAQQSNRPSNLFWRQRNLKPRLRGVRRPVLWAHGFLDGRDDFDGVRPDNFLGAWSQLRGPRRAWLGQWSHIVPGERGQFGPEPVGRRSFLRTEIRFFVHYLKRAKGPSPVHGHGRVIVQDGFGRWRAQRSWPPHHKRHRAVKVRSGSYFDLPGNKAEAASPGEECAAYTARGEPVARCNPASSTGQGSWSFTTPVRRRAWLMGAPRLTADVSSPAINANLIAIVYDIDRAGQATMLTRGAYLVRRSGRVSFALYPQDWPLRRGHRLGLLLTGSDDAYFQTSNTLARVSVSDARLELPLARCLTGHAVAGKPSLPVRTRTSFAISAATIAARTTARSSIPATPRCVS